MNSMERVMTTLSFKEADRVPLFHLLSLYGAKEAGLSPRDYFADPDVVVETQLAMKEKYANDCLYSFHYAPIEVEAAGAEVVFAPDGPPNSGAPLLASLADIDRFAMPFPEDSPVLSRVLTVTRELARRDGGATPIIGVVMSPFSLPVMQLGFERYLELLYKEAEHARFQRLMQVNAAFCRDWANAQLAAGATAICYFNPLASSDMIETPTYRRSGLVVDKETLAAIKGPCATHLASGRTLGVLDDLMQTDTAVLGFSAADDRAALKARTYGKVNLLGALNGIEMARWSQEEAERAVRLLLDDLAPGGGFILSDNHGETPWQVAPETLLAVSDAVKRHGSYRR